MAMSRAGRKRLILAAAAVVVIAGLAGAAWVKQVRLEANMATWRAEGNAAYERGDYEQALDLLNRYVSREKGDAEVLLNFADTRRQIPLPNEAHLEAAQQIVQTALAIEPQSYRGWVMMMEIYTAFSSPRLTEAREAAERVINIAKDEQLPPNLAAYHTRISALLYTNQLADAREKAIEMADDLGDDLAAQSYVFGVLVQTEAEPEQIEQFLAQREARFAGRLGLELMRAKLLALRIERLPEGDTRIEGLDEEFREIVDRALTAPAESAGEVFELIQFLEAAHPSNAALAEQTLNTYMDDPTLAPDLAAFAAERLWSRGWRADAGRVIVEHVPDLTQASDEVLGWLALSDTPEAATADELLAGRSTTEAQRWRDVAAADRAIREAKPDFRADAIPSRAERGSSLERIQLYLRGWAFRVRGETARAAAEWRRLLDVAPRWSVARRELGTAYATLGRLLEARDVLSGDRITTGTTEYLLVEVRIDERKLTRLTVAPYAEEILDSFQILYPSVQGAPDSYSMLPLAARAAIATGHEEEAKELTDQILAGDIATVANDAVTLAACLAPIDPERAGALRDAVSRVAATPQTVFRLAVADANAGNPDRGRERIEEQLAQAGDTTKIEWETTRALYLDQIGDPEAARTLLDLSAAYPDRLEAQLAALQADSTWINPDPLGAVIDRLQKITGRDGTLWRVYRNKLTIANLDPKNPQARDVATGVLLELSTISNADTSNAVAAETMARAAEFTGNYRNVAEFMLRAVRADPDNLPLRLELINTVLPRAGRLDEARDQAAALVELPLISPIDRRDRAETLERYGLAELAAADWQALADAGDPSAIVRRAAALAANGRQSEADELMKPVLADPDLQAGPRLNAAIYLTNADRYDQALVLIDAANDEDLLGQFLVITTDDADRAKYAADRARDADTPTLWKAAVQSYLALNDPEGAKAVLGEALGLHPEAAELRRFAVFFEAGENRAPNAGLLELRALIDDDGSPIAQRIATLIDANTEGRIDGTRLAASLSALVEEDGNDSLPAWGALAAAYEALGNNEAMADTYRDAMQALPGNAAIAAIAARRLDAAGMSEDSFRAHRAWRDRLGRPDFDADRAFAIMLTDRGQWRQAMTAIEPWQSQIIEDREAEPGDATFLAVVLAENGDDSDAIAIMRPLLDQSEERTLGYCVTLAERLKDHDLCRDWLDELLPRVAAAENGDLASRLALAWQQWATAENEAEREDVLAATEAAETLMASPAGRQVPVVRLAALGRDYLDDTTAAEAHYRLVLELDPSRYNMHNNLAVVLLKRGEVEEALSHADQALALAAQANADEAEMRAVMDTRADALEAAGRDAEAKQIRAALESDDLSDG